MSHIFQDELVTIKVQESEIPWLVIYLNSKTKELSQTTSEEKIRLFELLDTIEKEMLSFYAPTKINIASFGNMYPHMHFHIMARFEDDGFYPEPMWGARQRESITTITDVSDFVSTLISRF